MFYMPSDDVPARAREHYRAHAAHARDFYARGTLLMIGAFADSQHDGAMGVFTTREAADEFAKSDPFVRHGVVSDYQIREWMEIVDVPSSDANMILDWNRIVAV
jgi:uncharacterized protein YciI